MTGKIFDTSSTILEVMPQELWKLEEVKAYIRVSGNYDDVLIENLIRTAISAAEDFTNLGLIQREIETVFCKLRNRSLQLLHKPIDKILKIATKNDQEYDAAQYFLNKQMGSICLFVDCAMHKEIIVRYISGLASNNVPISIKHGILLHVAEMYDRNDVFVSPLSPFVKNLYLSHRQLKL